jgi:hypothetical protein
MAKSRICSIPDCGKRVEAHGWCVAHYNRWYRHGSPLGGGISKGEALRYFREVVLTYDGTDCLTWPYDCSTSGYGRLHYNGKQKNVSRLVCEEIEGEPPTECHEAAHSCGNGHLGCVAKRHLSWKTPAENSSDKFEHGTNPAGEKNGGAKLSKKDVAEIRRLLGSMKQQDIADRFCVSSSLVSQIKSGKLWNG